MEALHRPPASTRSIGWIALLLCAVVLVAIRPVAVPLVLAAWFAALSRPMYERIAGVLRGRKLAAGLITAMVIVILIAVLGLLYAILSEGAMGLLDSIARAKGPRGALEALVTDRRESADLQRIQKLLQGHGEQAASVAKYGALLGLGTLLFLFFLGLGITGLLAEGARLYGWMRAHAPLAAGQFDRLGAAFTETGRGVFCYIGLTCVTQGVLCTVTFAALGVPRPLVLGFVCALFAILPVVGTPLVWVPVASALILTGATAKGIILLLVGGAVIGAIEFAVGPMFAKVGKLRLDSGLVVLSMFAGALGLGPGGLILGPLAMRLAKESIELSREARS